MKKKKYDIKKDYFLVNELAIQQLRNKFLTIHCISIDM